jgi:hypothetical protein
VAFSVRRQPSRTLSDVFRLGSLDSLTFVASSHVAELSLDIWRSRILGAAYGYSRAATPARAANPLLLIARLEGRQRNSVSLRDPDRRPSSTRPSYRCESRPHDATKPACRMRRTQACRRSEYRGVHVDAPNPTRHPHTTWKTPTDLREPDHTRRGMSLALECANSLVHRRSDGVRPESPEGARRTTSTFDGDAGEPGSDEDLGAGRLTCEGPGDAIDARPREAAERKTQSVRPSRGALY